MDKKAKPEYDALILDVDGTLWDATETFAAAYTDASRETAPGLSVAPHHFTAGDIRKQLGKPTLSIFKDLYPEVGEIHGPSEAVRIWTLLMESALQKEYDYIPLRGGRLYPGLEETVRNLADRLPLYIVSNCEKGYIESFLTYSGLESSFSGWLCFGDTGLEKDKTLGVLKEKYKILRGAYVGDLLNDAVCARKAGMDFIWAAYGFGQVPEEMYDSKIGAFSELPALLW